MDALNTQIISLKQALVEKNQMKTKKNSNMQNSSTPSIKSSNRNYTEPKEKDKHQSQTNNSKTGSSHVHYKHSSIVQQKVEDIPQIKTYSKQEFDTYITDHKHTRTAEQNEKHVSQTHTYDHTDSESSFMINEHTYILDKDNEITNDEFNRSPITFTSTLYNYDKDSDSSSENEQPSLPFISKNTSSLIIGDSVVNGIYSRKMNVNNEKCKVISISGLDTFSLSDYLYNSPVNTNVKTLIVHIGINNAKKGHIITQDTWKRIIKDLKIKFPNAHISMSTILPYREKHPTIINATDESNNNLECICEDNHIDMINNDDTFLTQDNMVKTGWYKDNIHPNKRGTSGLAVHFKKHISKVFSSDLKPNSFMQETLKSNTITEMAGKMTSDGTNRIPYSVIVAGKDNYQSSSLSLNRDNQQSSPSLLTKGEKQILLNLIQKLM